MLVPISRLPPTNERPQSINSSCGGSERYTAMNCIVLFLNWVSPGQSLQSNVVYNFTNIPAMPNRFDFFTCSSRFNIEEPAVCFTVPCLSAVFRVGLPSCLIFTAMSDSKSLNTSLLEVMISFKNECVLIRVLGNLTLWFIFDAWWAGMNVDSKRPSAWNDTRHAPWWRFYLHRGIE